MNTWRLLTNPRLPGSYNMAVDEAIMQNLTDTPVLRIYQWENPTLSLGYFQNAELEVDLLACRELGIPVVRRPTGGRAVLHHKEVTYSLSLPLDYPNLPKGVTESYLFISEALVKGLSYLGVSATLAPKAKKPPARSAACFDAPSYYELLVEEKKIIGSAQTRKNGILLQHGSLLLDLDLALYTQALRFSSPAKRLQAQQILKGKATTLKEVMKEEPLPHLVYEALIRGFTEAFSIPLLPSELTKKEEETAKTLEQETYRDLALHPIDIKRQSTVSSSP